MQELPPLTHDLALRIEGIIAQNALADTPTVVQFGNAFAGKAQGGRLRNWVFCFGAEDVKYLDDILAFYAEDGLEPHFSLSPTRFTREVGVALAAAGFKQEGFEQAILYGLPDVTPPPQTPGVTIERVTLDNLDEFARISAEGFGWSPEWREAAMESLRECFDPTSYRYLARYEGEPAGVAAFGVNEGDVAGLGHGAVVPRFRRKGCHLALIRYRLFLAHELGCSLVLGGASFTSASFRNQQRAGLQLAYIESDWGRGG